MSIPQRVVNHQGLNIPVSQDTHIPNNLKHETVIVPSTNTPSWGGYFLFDFKEKALTLHDLTIQMNVSALTGLTGTSIQARYSTAYSWISRIEILLNNQVHDTIYPETQFLLQNLFNYDEDRTFCNNMAGNYASVTQRASLASATNDYFIPLWTFFNQCHVDLLYPKDDLQLRVYMNPLSKVATANSGYGGSPISSINFSNLICRVTRNGSDINSAKMLSLSKHVHHHKFLETRYGTYSLTSGQTQYTIVLNSIVGKVDFLLFVVRPTGWTGDGFHTFSPVSNFSILDSTSTNITGGQPISSALALGKLARDFAKSSYQTYLANGAYAYFYSFSADACDAMETGRSYNHFKFQGQEQLQLTFSTATASSFSVDVYAFVQSVLEISPSYVKKVSL